LLASSSLAALVIGCGAQAAWAQCAINDVGITVPAVGNSGTINCINIKDSTVNSNVGNAGKLTTGGISVYNSAVTGAIINSGTISSSGNGIAVSTAVVFGTSTGGGIANSGTISGGGGIVVQFVSTFWGGITNSGTISVTGWGIIADNGSAFSGGITNNGTISAGGDYGIIASGISTFSGGITNSGTISAGYYGIGVNPVSTFSGGISNSGTISSNVSGIGVASVAQFGGGITNTGAISASQVGIGISSVSAFSGGITNSSTISADRDDISVSDISTFLGGITNIGTISAGPQLGVHYLPTWAVVVSGVSTFSGGITNIGTITAPNGILVQNVSTFLGGINNSGTLGGGISTAGISTFSGGITNSGMILAGATAINVNAVSTFSGGISNSGTISAGFNYAIVVGGSISTYSGGISNSGAILAPYTGIAVGGISTFSGGITNSGTISAGGSHAITVSNISTFWGGITNAGTISSGFVGIAVGGSISAFLGGISNSGTILALNTGIAEGGGSTFSGGISNSGRISVGGGYGIAVGGVSTFSGGITNSGAITGNVGIGVGANTGPVSVFDSGTVVGTGGTAIWFFNAGGNTLTLGPGYSVTGNVLGSGSDTFQLGGTSNGTFNLSSIGAAQQYQGFTTFNEVGNATWAVTGTFGQTNPWTVQSGTLLVNGNLSSASALTINGGTLGGTGTVGNAQINSGGTFAPGTPGVPGTSMTVSGNLAFQSGAIYLVQVNPTTATMANVSGTATLAGNALAAFSTGTYLQKQYTILQSAGLDGTTFASLGTTNLAGFTASLSYTSNDVFLNIKPGLSANGLGGNQGNIANALSSFFNNGGTLTPNFLTVFGLTGGNLANALSQLSGEAAAGGQKASITMMSSFLGLTLDPFITGRGGGGGSTTGFAPEQQANFPPDIALAYDSVLKAAPPVAFDHRWSAWGSSFGGYNKTNGDPASGTTTVTANAYGFAGGMDYHFTPDTFAGFALAGAGSNWDLAEGLGGGRSDSFQTGLYGKTNSGPAYLAASLSFANHWMTTNRTALGDQLTASFDAQSYGARLESGYRYALMPTIGLAPYAALQAQWFHTPSYSETDLSGGGFGLSYNAATATDTRSELGARFDDLTTLDALPLRLWARTAWAHDWVSNSSLMATFQALPGASFIVNGATVPTNSALASAGAELHITTNWSVAAKFDGEFAPSSQTYTGTGTLRYAW
jgi:uncharacterized protein with beta-barrel porin domain